MVANDGTIRAVEPYLPSCSAYSLQDFQNDFPTRGVAFNLSDAGNYVYEKVVPSLVPGIVLGCIALVGFIFFLIWMCVGCVAHYCCCCCRKKRGKGAAQQAAADGAADVFIVQADGQPASSYGLDAGGKGAKPPMKASHKAFWALLVLLALATIGVAAWGLAESILSTDDTVSDFWDLVDSAQSRVETTIEAMQALQNGTSRLAGASTVLSNNSASVAAALSAVAAAKGFPLASSDAARVSNLLAAVPGGIESGATAIGSAVAFMQDNVNDTIADIENKFEPPTMAVQNTWRFIPFAVIFGVTILVIMLMLPALWHMTWPRSAALLVALLWLCIALLMLVGTAMLNGVYVVSNDGCLFAETFVVHYAWRKTSGSQWGQTVVNMVQYYLGLNTSAYGGDIVPAGDTGSGGLDALQVYLPANAEGSITDVSNLLQNISAAVPELVAASKESDVLSTITAAAGSEVASALQTTGEAVDTLQLAIGNLSAVANRTNVELLYHEMKEYVCCTLSDSAHQMWVAWTVVGSLGIALALMASAVVVNIARTRRKNNKALQAAGLEGAGGAALWHKDPKPADAPAPAPQYPPEPHAAAAPVRDASGNYAYA